MPRYINYKRHRVRHGLKHDRHVPVARITSQPTMQYSAEGGATPAWSASIGATDLRAGVPVDYFVQLTPGEILPEDVGQYSYNFRLVPDESGAVPGQPNTTGIGGLTLTWSGNYAHIQGQVPSDQVGKIITIEGTVKDMGGNIITGGPLVGTWTA